MKDQMKIVVDIVNYKIVIKEEHISDTYYIEKCDERGRFFVTSTNGYNGFEGDGFTNLEDAIKSVKVQIKDHFSNRCEPAPCKGFNQLYNQ
jgi:hypothetical protein